MDRRNLKEILHRLKEVIEELEVEIYSDTDAYQPSGSYIGDDDDGYPDWQTAHVVLYYEHTELNYMNTVVDFKSYIKQIKKALKQDHLYSQEELRKMKTDLRNLVKTDKMIRERQNNGFGQYLNLPDPVKIESTIASQPEEDVVESVDVEVVEDTNEVWSDCR